MKTIAISGWLAYAPFWAAKDELEKLGVRFELAGGRDKGLSEGRFEAAMLSNYQLAVLLDAVGDDFAVSWAFVEPVGDGSSRIVVRPPIKSVTDLFNARIGICPGGVEHILFEHIFYIANLERKWDYVALGDQARYMAAFRDGIVDAVLAPQPERSRIQKAVAGAEVFEGNGHVPRYGLYVVLVHRRSEWQPDELKQVQNVVCAKAAELATLNDEALRAAYPRLFGGLERPAHEVRSTLRWLSPAESDDYLLGDAEGSFRRHLQRITKYRAERLGSSPLDPERITGLVRKR